ncbi:uncharacterized protein METZ01_LOCUS22624 [marine metagenome]|uniref:Uncharacterized protein n=1 Tax=marine metagenome TaxID=408172 RepID=A0A381PS77_9ZZZZ
MVFSNPKSITPMNIAKINDATSTNTELF